MREVSPPPYPYAVNADLAAQGKTIFESTCASCHSFDGERTGTVIPFTEVGTDPSRANHWTQTAAAAFRAFPDEQANLFPNVRDTDGYTAVPLDGLWARSPYLHNGSVPNLAALLTPPDQRPTTFYRGFDLYDTEAIGFISEGEEASQAGFLLDTRVIGNGNQGHTYGTDLDDEEKRSLLEYLKTL
jgi:hypothetical protein